MIRPFTASSSFLRRRPWTTASLSLTGATVVYASAIEYRAHRLTQQQYNYTTGTSADTSSAHTTSATTTTAAGITDRHNSDQHVVAMHHHHCTPPPPPHPQQHIVALPRDYDWEAVHTYWSHRPCTAAVRLLEIASHLLPLVGRGVLDFVVLPRLLGNTSATTTTTTTTATTTAATTSTAAATTSDRLYQQHAVQWRQALTKLGPAFVKAGQQLSIRPDLLPAVVLKELQRLCDQVEPVADDIALQLLREQWGGRPLEEILLEPLPRRVASASLGQVYIATLRPSSLPPSALNNQNGSANTNVTNTTTTPPLPQKVAIKVQRPDMLERFSLDLFLLQNMGRAVDAMTSLFTQQPPFHRALYEAFARGSYQELDYEHEAASQTEFRHQLAARRILQQKVVVPQVHHHLTTRTVLTTEWIDGIQLVEASPEELRRLIPVGVELFLTQLLDIGKFHA